MNGERRSCFGDSNINNSSLEKQLEMKKKELIQEQQKRILQLEEQLKKSQTQIQELLIENSQLKELNQKTKSDQSSSSTKSTSRYWTAEEHDRFLEALEKFGPKDVKSIAAFVATRNPTQVRTHAQKYYLRIQREKRKQEELKKLESGGSLNSSFDMSLDQDDIQKSPESSNQVFQESSSEINGAIYGIPSNEFDSHFGSEPSRGGSGGPIKKIRKNVNIKLSSSPAPFQPTIQQSYQPNPCLNKLKKDLKQLSKEEVELLYKGMQTLHEANIDEKCRLISEKFLPNYSPEEIKSYIFLFTSIKNEENINNAIQTANSNTFTQSAIHPYSSPYQDTQPIYFSGTSSLYSHHPYQMPIYYGNFYNSPSLSSYEPSENLPPNIPISFTSNPLSQAISETNSLMQNVRGKETFTPPLTWDPSIPVLPQNYLSTNQVHEVLFDDWTQEPSTSDILITHEDLQKQMSNKIVQ